MVDSQASLRAATGAPAPGEVVAGRYRVEDVLAHGGMGVVVAARHVELNQRVAVKFLLADAVGEPELVTRFLREARAAVGLQGEHAVRVSDVGTMDSGGPYMVMEYLEGHDLKEALHAGPLSTKRAVDYVLQACEAIAEAHSLGIVHRDLKPSNLFLTRRPDGSALIKVLDFGISKVMADGLANREDQRLTATTAVLGSPVYMSPEQVRSARTVDSRSDIWSLGVVLYELLAADVPFQAETVPALSAMIVADPPTPLHQYRTDLPDGLEAAVMRCLEKTPEKRFQKIADFVEAIAPFASPDSRTTIDRALRISRDSMPDMSAEAAPLLPTLAEARRAVISTDAETVAAPSDGAISVNDTGSGAAAARADDSLRPPVRTGSSEAIRRDAPIGVAETFAATAGEPPAEFRKRRAPVWMPLGAGIIAIGGVAALLWPGSEPTTTAEPVAPAAASARAPAPPVAVAPDPPESTAVSPDVSGGDAAAEAPPAASVPPNASTSKKSALAKKRSARLPIRVKKPPKALAAPKPSPVAPRPAPTLQPLDDRK